MRIAVLFTGQIRTLWKTLPAFRENVVAPAVAEGYEVHVFACLECPPFDTSAKTLLYQEEIRQLFVSELGGQPPGTPGRPGHFVTDIEWLPSENPELAAEKQAKLRTMAISDRWADYLGNGSGSMTEYYQLERGLAIIRAFSESEGRQPYDLFMRTRCDLLFPHAITFSGFDPNIDISKRISYTVHSTQQLGICIANLLCPVDEEWTRARMEDPSLVVEHFRRTHNPAEWENVRRLINNTCLSFRQNVLYVGWWKHMSQLAPFTHYGMGGGEETRLKTDHGNKVGKPLEGERDYWFNAENQFQKNVVQIDRNIHLFNSHTISEESSLYEFDPTKHPDPNGHQLFCLIRR